jgi:hypothetical protein
LDGDAHCLLGAQGIAALDASLVPYLQREKYTACFWVYLLANSQDIAARENAYSEYTLH